MPRSFNLSASSPDAWQALQLQYADRFTNAAIGNRDDARQAAVINLNAFLQAQREDQALRERDQRTRLGLWEFGIKRGDQQNLLGEDRRRFDINTGLTRDQLANERLKIGVLETKELEKAAKAAETFQETFAAEKAEKGLFASKAELAKEFKALSPEAVEHWFSRNQEVREVLSAEQKRIEDSRDVLNKAAQLRQYVTLSEQSMKEMPRYQISGGERNPDSIWPFAISNPGINRENRLIKDWNAELYGPGYDPRRAGSKEPNNLFDRAALLEKQKDVQDTLTMDPNSGRYVLRDPRPAFFTPATSTATMPDTAAYPPAPLNPAARTAGAIYSTPARGPMLWTGGGWRSP